VSEAQSWTRKIKREGENTVDSTSGRPRNLFTQELIIVQAPRSIINSHFLIFFNLSLAGWPNSHKRKESKGTYIRPAPAKKEKKKESGFLGMRPRVSPYSLYIFCENVASYSQKSALTRYHAVVHYWPISKEQKRIIGQ
jgi:hypothetical protein